MNRATLFLPGLGFGAALVVFLGYFGLMIGGLFLLLLAPLVVRGGLPVLSGMLVGFGGIWTGLTLTQFDRGGATSDGGPWLAVGLVPLIVGVGILVLALVRNRPTPDGGGVDAVP
jgi:hypothetical protein